MDSIKEKKVLSKFYYPYCPYCLNSSNNQVLDIYFNDNFTIDVECIKDDNHNREKIYFNTFERFFIKEKEFDICSKCYENIEIDSKYICKECKKIYCNLCFISDEHIKRNINNLEIKNNKCPKHQGDLIYFCFKCKELLCINCLKYNQDKTHEEHNTINVIENMPSVNELENLLNKINEKEKEYEKLINLLDKWSKAILKKVEELKNNLKKEIELLRKLFKNFNIKFPSFSYGENFYNIKNYIKNINNESLNKFYTSNNFEKQTKNLFDFFFPNKYKIKHKSGYLNHYSFIGNKGIVSKITDNLFFVYSSKKKKVLIYDYQISDDLIHCYAKLNFDNHIFSISSTINNDLVYIYACLLGTKKMKIFIYNIKDSKLKLSDFEVNYENEDYSISDNEDNSDISHFTKCIQLSNQLIAISDNRNLSIWEKKEDLKNYTKIKTINFQFLIKDIFLIDKKYFVCLLSEEYNDEGDIKYYNIENLIDEKTIKNIDCMKKKMGLIFLIQQFLLIKGEKGISILSNKTKDLVQYIDFNSNIYEIIPHNNDNFYILLIDRNLTSNLSFEKYKLIEGSFIKTTDYINLKFGEEEKEEIILSEPFSGFCINRKDIFIWQKSIFHLKK